MIGSLALGATLGMGVAFAVDPGAGLGAPGVAVPVYALDGPCKDPRYPALAGAWAVGCGPGGAVDRAIDLRSGRRVEITPALDRPGLGEGWLYAPGQAGGLLRLEGAAAIPVDDIALVYQRPNAPPATDGRHIVVLFDDGVEAFVATERARRRHPAAPLGWQPPALLWPLVAWVEAGEGEDLWVLDLSVARPEPRLLAGGPGDQRLVVAGGGRLAWVDGGDLVILDPQSGARRRIPARTGFASAPTVDGDAACWEERTAHQGLDIACTDGWDRRGPGHQHHPSRYGPWLLYRDGDRVMLYTAATP